MFNKYLFNDSLFNDDGGSNPSRLLLSIEKDITLSVTSSGLLLSIEKEITADQPSTILLSIEKRITDTENVLDFYTRFGWEPIVVLDGLEVGGDELEGQIVINKVINDNHTAKFSLILKPNTYSLYQFQGADVKIYYHDNDTIDLLFTGIVDTPSVNVLQEKLTLSCIADRRTLLGNLGAIVPYIGYYSPVVLTTSDDPYTQINDRLTTIPYDLDFDSANNYSLTSWTPKATQDFTFGPNTVYRRTPQMSIQSSNKVINKVNIILQYQYQRLHHREMVYSWRHPYAPTNEGAGTGGICPFLEDAPTRPTRESIHSAASGTGWALKEDTFYYARDFKDGSYQCAGVWVQWSNTQTGYLNANVYDTNGNPVLDGSGNQVTRSVQTILADNTYRYAMRASWNASKRFNQNVTEYYRTSVEAPSSQALYGVLESNESYNYVDPSQHAEWSQYSAWAPPPAGVTPNYDALNASYIINAADNRASFYTAYLSALNKAKTTILNSHRDTRITFQCPIKPTMELKHTCKLTGKWMKGSGKCTTITHTLNVSSSGGEAAGKCYTEVTLSAYRATYAVSETTMLPSAIPVDNYVPIQPGIALQTHIGEDPSQPGAQNWTGYVGNKVIVQRVASFNSVFPSTNITRSNYQESFIVNAPAITDLTQDKYLYGRATYNVNIPTDNVQYVAYRGKGHYE